MLKKKLLAASLATALTLTAGVSNSGFQLILPNDGVQSPDSNPVVTAITPNALPAATGGSLVISGADLQDGADVSIGSSTYVSLLSGNDLFIDAGPEAAGLYDVVVTNPDGQFSVMSDALTFYDYVALTSITPNKGTLAGGETVSISGEGFSAGTSVSFDGVSASVTRIDDSNLEAVVPAHAAGLVEVTISSPYDSLITSNAYEFMPPATISSIAPSLGHIDGGDLVTITGENFAEATDVLVDGTSVAYTVNTDTSIDVTMPAHIAGLADVQVISPYGNATQIGGYEYIESLDVVGLSPSKDGPLGGKAITITGTSLQDSVVTIGGEVAPVVSNDGSTLVVTSPAIPTEGLVDVIVTGTYGSETLVESFRYAWPAKIASLTPSSGPVEGLAGVAVYGYRLRNGLKAYVDGVETTYTRVDNNNGFIDMPPHAVGTVTITLEDPNFGWNDVHTVGADQFEYGEVPVISDWSAGSGSTEGGQTLVLTGTGFTEESQVFFDEIEADSITFDSDTQLTVVIPAHEQGDALLTVTNQYGVSAHWTFQFFPPPEFTSITPGYVGVSGGETVTITGNYFRPNMNIKFNGVRYVNRTVNGDTEVVVEVPPGVEGPATVELYTYYGEHLESGVFEYIGAPTIDSLTGVNIKEFGTRLTTINGTGFTPDTTVMYGTVPAANIEYHSSTKLVTSAPPQPAGYVDLIVDNGYGSVTSTNALRYVDPPEVHSLSATTGGTAGGETITLTGDWMYNNNTVVTVDGIEVPWTYTNRLYGDIVMPAHAAGPVDITFTNVWGSETVPDAYTYVASPSITAIDPSGGTTNGGRISTITGSNFTPDTAVTIGGESASVTYNSATSLTVAAPAYGGGQGSVDVVVSNAYGSDTLADGYYYKVPPVMTSISPATGAEAGGDTVVITGSGFANTNWVKFDGVDAPSVSVNADKTELTVITPPGVAGPADVRITHWGDEVTYTNAFTYESPVQPLTASLTKLSNNGGNGAATLGDVSLRIDAAGGVEPYTYHWQEVGSTTLAISPMAVVSCGEGCTGYQQEDPTCSNGNWVSTDKSDVYVYLGSGSGTNCTESGSGGSGSFRLKVVDAVGTEVTTNSVTYSFVGW